MTVNPHIDTVSNNFFDATFDKISSDKSVNIDCWRSVYVQNITCNNSKISIKLGDWYVKVLKILESNVCMYIEFHLQDLNNFNKTDTNGGLS